MKFYLYLQVFTNIYHCIKSAPILVKHNIYSNIITHQRVIITINKVSFIKFSNYVANGFLIIFLCSLLKFNFSVSFDTCRTTKQKTERYVEVSQLNVGVVRNIFI